MDKMTPLRRATPWLACLAMLLLSLEAQAAGWVVGSGSELRLGDGSLEVGCGDLRIDAGGTLSAQQGVIRLAGDWDMAGAFDPGTGAVEFGDGCASAPGPLTSTVSGNSVFFDFTASTTAGTQLVFESGSVQAILGNLALAGSAGNLLAIRSTTDGREAFLDLAAGGLQAIDFVDVRDNHAIGLPLAPGPPSDFNSVDSGNTDGWFRSVLEIPTLSTLGRLSLILLLVGLSLAAIQRRAL